MSKEQKMDNIIIKKDFIKECDIVVSNTPEGSTVKITKEGLILPPQLPYDNTGWQA